MKKATLSFEFPEDDERFLAAVHASDLKYVIRQYDQYLRNLIKHGSDEQLKEFNPESARQYLWDLIRDNGIDILMN